MIAGGFEFNEDGAIYKRVTSQIKQAIQSGSLLPDARLPSVRALASQYGVSLTTALKALRTLEDENYAVVKPKAGFFVARPKNIGMLLASIVHEPKKIAPLDELTELHLSMLGTDCRIRLDLANGISTLYPIKKLGLLMRQIGYAQPALLGDTIKGTGYLPLKTEIARRAVNYGCNIDINDLLITNGCVEAISLALRATVVAGDAVAVESPCYFVLLQMLQNLGLKVVEVETSSLGYVNTETLDYLFTNQIVKAFVTLANNNNPLGTTIPDSAKQFIARLADEHGVVIIEDDIFGDTTYGDQRPFPMLAFTPNAILCSGFSKTVAPAIRIGWIYSALHMRKITALKYTSSMGTSLLPQAAVAEILRNGGYDLHLRKLRKELYIQLSKIREAVLQYFPAGTIVSAPKGGYVLWVEMPPGSLNARELFLKARSCGIGIAPGHIFATDTRFDNCFRLNAGFGWNEGVLAAIQKLATWCAQSLAEYQASLRQEITTQDA
ncbi:PLP-dependent aminotransferase family protein [Pseudomonas sp. CCI3.2]|uniref:aminotransferase-like domain-containing protein n=1 Tax=unclassified Pseudomonas TaxID=196821 RepID=UPI002AC8D98A|nr:MULTISPECIES: PLP-dependent aminotransferase family protein [unclassified Pseudomonas]MEB0077905.1 PLP-dependent aminotransferase family protein [Pseudomonas sp. MH10out]MEB0102797.1 PLP-dependent aminotransferase family protein [Pseudomonas sp. CCI3.2]MEB0131725.1 PLP-dependent aminotransferase family protein [Pseudomonas sp. CCI2.4]MEB0159492.1 PLP-dependent aminotransferase family protein [Pseudomonas sp. AH2 (2023)]MEB0170253.1 PLP-dependent aminotransferase family protein [Pseudomonas 